jgi:hypothetical protein
MNCQKHDKKNEDVAKPESKVKGECGVMPGLEKNISEKTP